MNTTIRSYDNRDHEELSESQLDEIQALRAAYHLAKEELAEMTADRDAIAELLRQRDEQLAGFRDKSL